MAIFIALGLGAGLVSALLFAAVTASSAPSVLLMYLTPLPILIVALGWHQLLGLLALAVGGLAISLVLRPSAALAFALGPALAAWLLAMATLAVRAPAPGPDGVRSGGAGWYPAGSLLLSIGVGAAAIAVAALTSASGGDYASYRDALEEAASAVLRQGGTAALPRILWMDGAAFIRLMISLAPALLAALLTVIFTTNLWIAARAVAISGRLSRPWPDVPSARMPVAAVPLVLVGCLLGRAAGFVGVAGTALAGGLLMAFALQGLALMHDVSRHRPGRGLVLSLAYVLTFVLGYVVLPALAILGLADSALPLRRALGSSPPPSPPLSGPPS